MNVLHRRILVNDGFGVSKVVTSRLQTRNVENRQKLEDVDLLDEDDSQTQKQLVEQLVVSQQTVSNRPREMGKTQNTERWALRELNDRQMEKHKTHMIFCLLVTKGSRFCIV